MHRKILGGYFLGCAMLDAFKAHYTDLLLQKEEDAFASSVYKENLIVIDPDIMTDYPIQYNLPLSLPTGYKVIFARNIPRDHMPLVLKRAKIGAL
jgi:hypothetical protein